jgi:hypothetical protein
MRSLILAGLVVAGLVAAGAIHISQSNGNIEVSIDRQKVQAVAGQVAREGEEIIKQAASEAGSKTR